VITTLLNHQWKAFWRSRNAGKNIAMQIFMAFIIVYLLATAIVLGFSVSTIINKAFPNQDPEKVFCGFILYYFLFDMLFRFLWQELPTLSIQPYLAQNIQRKQLTRFLNIRSLFTFLNLLPILLFIPFAVSSIFQTDGSAAAIAFIICIISLTCFNHFTILFIKRKTIINGWWLVAFFVTIALCMAGDYFNVFSVSAISSTVFLHILKTPLLCIIPIALAFFSVVNNTRFLKQNLYLEELSSASAKKESANYTWLNRFGIYGELIGLDLKLILRNKRPRSAALMSVALLFYGFLFYKPETIEQGQYGVLLLGATFVTGIFIITYGQFLFAWHGNFFDGLMAGNFTLQQYIKSRFLLFAGVGTITFMLVSFYGFMSWKILIIQLAAYLYNTGFNTVLSIYFATRSYKGLDLSKSASFNYQGTGAAQWIYGLVFMLFGAIVYLPFALLFNAWAGVIAIGLFGLVNILLQDWWVQILANQLMQRKHKILEGFREK